MKRLTTDNPENNVETMLNLAYVKDGWVHIREMDEPFIDYIKRQCCKQGCDLSEMGEIEFVEAIFECAFSNPECPIFLLHTIATQAAELRTRLFMHEDAAEIPELNETISDQTE